MKDFYSLDTNRVLIIERTDLKEKYQETPVRKLPLGCLNNKDLYYKMSTADIVLFKDSDDSLTVIEVGSDIIT